VSRDRRNGRTLLGVLPPSARAAVGHAWIEVLNERHPEFRWTLLRPGERLERNRVPAARETIRRLAAPENQDAFLERNGTTRAAHGSNHDGVDGGGD
jgi:hypothetical protein